jgi:hypothetical protein
MNSNESELLLKTKEIEKQAILDKDVELLCKYYFGFELTKGQVEIVRAIAYEEYRRLSVSAYTRYGKTRCVALGVCLYILFNINKKIAIIAPQKEQTDVLREYIADCIIRCDMLRDIVELEKTRDVFSMKKEASKERQTFKNGCEYRVFSAYGEAYRLMGFGANLIVKDEAALIEREASSKIGRMLGDDPENSMLVEITNPWDRDTIAYEHHTNPAWKTIQIGYVQGIEEGRITQDFIEEQRHELSPIEFTVLYESEYPEESEDALFKWIWIQKARSARFEDKVIKTYLGCDIAEAGVDFTVVTCVAETENKNYIVKEIKHWHKADTMETVGEIDNIQRIHKPDKIKVDAIGVGKGVGDRLRKLGLNTELVKVGESATREPQRFSNQKAQFYWRLRTLFEEGRISIIGNNNLMRELSLMKYELTSTGKIKIVDPRDKSPDYADSLMLACAESDSGLLFATVDKPTRNTMQVGKF